MSQLPAEKAAEKQSPDGKGARRRQDSRQLLLDAARKLFVERGYHTTRPQDISREAGLGHGTFYLHFRDKQDCFVAFIEQARAELDALVAERAATSRGLPEMVEAVLAAIYDYSDANPGVLLTAMTDETVIGTSGDRKVTLLQRWGEEWTELLKSQARAGKIASDVDFTLLGQAIVGAIHQASTYAQAQALSRAALVKSLKRFIVNALAPGA
jgi:AcrR family transcriptional regulator